MPISLPTSEAVRADSALAAKIRDVRSRIDMALQKAGRSPLSLRLVGSTRTLMVDPVIDAAQAGLSDFNEEYVPEGVTKRPPVDRTVPGLTWHYSGTIHSKNMAIAVEFFDWIHGLDRVTTIRSLGDAIVKKERQGIRILVEVNPLGEKKRAGAAPDAVPVIAEAVLKVPGAILAGLSFKSEPLMSKADRLEGFRRTAELSRKLLADGVLPSTAGQLAIGTSSDFEKAIELGSTLLRIGSALFQGRPTR